MPLAPTILILCLCTTLLGAAAAAAGVTAAEEPARRPASPVVAVAAELAADAAATRLVFTMSQRVAGRAFLLERPDRVIIDLPEVNFQLPAEAGQQRGGLVASFRYGLFAPGRSRIVIDLAQPALVARIASEVRAVDRAALMTIELVRTDRETFRRAAAADDAAPRPAPAAPVAAGARDDRRPVIAIDPGHGGVDPGATAAGVPEKDIVFSFAQRLRDRLERSGRYRVVMTREQDVFVALGERVRIARANKADLFISIHADSISAAPQVRGLTVYTGSEQASDAESERLADRENQADAVAGHDGGEGTDEVADILRDLTLRETRRFSYGFARKLVGELDGIARLNKNPYRQAGFTVLRAPDVPSVLVELGYLSSRKDIDLLMSDEWRDKSAGAMAAAIDRYFSMRLANRDAAAVSP